MSVLRSSFWRSQNLCIWRVAHISSFPTEAGAPRLAFETWDQTSRDIGQLRQPSIPEGPAFTRAIIDASAGRFRSAEGRSGARSAERPNCRPPSRHKSPPLSFPQNPQQIRMSTPSTLQNPPNPHPINHFGHKNTWHSSYAPTRKIKVGEKIRRLPASAGHLDCARISRLFSYV